MLNLGPMRTALLRWYDSNRRDLPWRAPHGATPDPYMVWLSEVMLQQTRVDTVRPYFERWSERFPTLDALASAELDDVLKAWEGLGYYSRARNFHAAVREVMSRYGGRVPDDPASFRALPGVGDYTAGAVMSIAFGRPEPAVDGNVRRVFARLLDEPGPPAGELRELAARLAAGERPGDLNQALMELGATVCTPRSPRCDECPVGEACAARRAGTQDERPMRKRRGPLPVEEYGVAAVHCGDRFLFVKRPREERLGGLWELPARLAEDGEDVSDAAARAVCAYTDSSGHTGEPVGMVQHDFSHVRAKYHLHLAPVTSPAPDLDPNDHRWLRLDQIDEIALPTAQRKLVRILRDRASAHS